MVNDHLKHHFDKNSVKLTNIELLKVVQCYLPVRISMSTKNVICQSMPNCKGVRTREKHMISCFISFSTQCTTLNHPPSPHPISRWRLVLDWLAMNENRSTPCVNQTTLLHSTVAFFNPNLIPCLRVWEHLMVVIIYYPPKDNISTILSCRNRWFSYGCTKLMKVTTSNGPSALIHHVTNCSSTRQTNISSTWCSSDINQTPLIQPIIKPKIS